MTRRVLRWLALVLLAVACAAGAQEYNIAIAQAPSSAPRYDSTQSFVHVAVE